MNSSGKRYSSIDSLQDENLQTNIDKNKSIIQKQNEQLVKLREHFVKLRNLYHDERRDYAMKSLSLQRAIDNTKRKGDQLEHRIQEIHASIENAANEKIANDLIEKLWSILNNFRKDVFTEADQDISDDGSFIKGNKSKEVHYGNSIKAAKSKSKRQEINLESDYDPFDQPLSSPIGMNSNLSNSDDFNTPSTIGDMTPITPLNDMPTPITPSSSSNLDSVVTTTPSLNENFCDSIASRRTRRRCTTNVYYKEPSLRSALTPGDPFTFSLEDGIVTPTVPDDYSRDTPCLNVKRGKYKNH